MVKDLDDLNLDQQNDFIDISIENFILHPF